MGQRVQRGERSLAALAMFAMMLGGLFAVTPSAGAATLTVCAEGCDHTTIQAAVDAAAAGDTIVVEDGSYPENVTIDRSLSLSCANAGISAGATPGARGAESTVQGELTITVADVIIDGCRFDRPEVASSAVPRLVRTAGVAGAVTVRNSVFDLTDTDPAASGRGSRGCGAGISGTAAWSISDSLFRNQFYSQATDACGNSGQRYTSRMIFAENAQPALIEGNRFESVAQSIFLAGSLPSGSTIVNNQFTNSSALFIGTPADVLVKGNTFDGFGAIYLDGSQDVIIENNLLTASPSSTYLVYSVNATSGTVLRNNAVLGKYTFGGPNFEGFGIFNLGAETMVATDNWWGVTTEAEIGAIIRQAGSVSFDPWLTSGESAANPDFRYTTGFWPPSSVGPGPSPRSGPATSAPPESALSAPGFLRTSDGAAPTVTPGSASIVTASGEQVFPEVTFGSGELLTGQTASVAGPGLRVESVGDRGVSPSSGPIASFGGEIESRIAADIPAGSVVEVWLFSTPRLVAAARADVAGQVDIVVPLSAPLDGGGPVEAGTHTLQLLIPTSAGLVGVNIGVTVGGPVPTSVPSGGAPSIPMVNVVVFGAVGLVLTAALRRRMRAACPA